MQFSEQVKHKINSILYITKFLERGLLLFFFYLWRNIIQNWWTFQKHPASGLCHARFMPLALQGHYLQANTLVSESTWKVLNWRWEVNGPQDWSRINHSQCFWIYVKYFSFKNNSLFSSTISLFMKIFMLEGLVSRWCSMVNYITLKE